MQNSENRYACIFILICDWRLICANFNNLRSHEHDTIAIFILWLRICTGNKNTVICIWICLQVIRHAPDISILYVRRVHNWIQGMWLKHNRKYKVICVIHNIQTCAVQFTRYAQSLQYFFLYSSFGSDSNRCCSDLP